MLLNTRHFGEIEIDEENIIYFDEGIPGFNHVKKFVLIGSENLEERQEDENEVKKKANNDSCDENSCDDEEALSPFKWLQCVDDPDLAFAIVNPFMIKPDYEIELSDEVIETLEIEKEEDVALYAIVVVPEDISKMTMNLKAPIVINVRNKKGMQAILDTEKYSIRHYIMEEIARQEVEADAGTIKKKRSVYSYRR
ncbi:MAG TPA: flagellar assembly protein FliW [Clostridiaceae bacterium]|nr:flagellar assembly protein FliW [Clostridiaceae bacterium]